MGAGDSVEVALAPGLVRPPSENISDGFAQDAAAKTGVTDRAVRYAVQIGEDITPEARDAIRGTPTADNQADLLRLAKLPEDEQVAVAEEVRDTGKTVKQVELERKREAIHEQTRGQNLTALVTLAEQADWLPAVCNLTDRFGPADLLLTDPPYSTDIEDIGTFAADWLPSALACVKDTGRAYVFIGAYPLELLSYLAVGLADERMVLEQVLVWTYRNTLGPSPTHTYKQNWQACLYFVGPEAPPLDCPLMNEQFSVQDVNAPDGRRGDRYHAWQKPDDLAERLVRHSTQPGDLVIDPFCGTGTFVLAAARLGRRGWGCDSDISMIDIALQRGCQNRDVTRERTE
jgi:predicted RNA methylase